MKIINNGIVFSNDIKKILEGNNALDFSYKKSGIIPPSEDFIEQLRLDFRKDVNKIFDNKALILNEEEMLESMSKSISDVLGVYPIISLDKIYLCPDNSNIIFLDCTRLDGSTNLVSRNNFNDFNDVDNQIKLISNYLKSNKINEIILADDVVFSGSVLKNIINKFKRNDIEVIGIRSCLSMSNPYDMFNQDLPLGLKCGYLMKNEVIDQICERDFYFGIVQSGISIKDKSGSIYKAPYFKPFGNPVERASVPTEYEKYFSEGCIKRSIYLWKEIEKNSNKEFLIKDLPEKIYLTNEQEKIIKVLKKGLK